MLLFSRLWIKVVKFAVFRSKTQEFAVFGQIRNFCEYRDGREKITAPRTSAGFWLGVNAPLPPEANKILKI